MTHKILLIMVRTHINLFFDSVSKTEKTDNFTQERTEICKFLMFLQGQFRTSDDSESEYI